MTPVLMVFGYLVGMGVFRVTTSLINMGFYYAIAGLSGNFLVWMLGMAVLTFLMVLSYIVLIERSFSLVAEFPSRVLRWVGGDAAVATGQEERIRTAAVGAAAASGKTAGGMAAGGMGRGAQAGEKFRNRQAGGAKNGE
jgi:hypothetical protein